MRFSRHNAQQPQPASLHATRRIVVAVMLLLALLSGSLPPGSLSSAAASECSMSCCIGKPTHAAGECATVSCHVQLPGHGKANDAPTHGEQVQHNSSAPASHRDDEHAAHQPEAKSQPEAQLHHQPQAHSTAQDDAHSEHTEAHHAETQTASQSATTNAQPASKSEAQQSNRRPSVAPASLANPCLPECGMAASSFGNSVRPRDATALTEAHRPRPPATAAAFKHSSALPLTFSKGKYRLAPPRAPPVAAPLTPSPA